MNDKEKLIEVFDEVGVDYRDHGSYISVQYKGDDFTDFFDLRVDFNFTDSGDFIEAEMLHD